MRAFPAGFLALGALIFPLHAETMPSPSEAAALATADRQRMMDLLGIPSLPAPPPPPGNQDPAKANPYPLPDPLTCDDGTPVRTASEWWRWRRPELLRAFLTDMYGHVSADLPPVRWEVTGTDRAALGGAAVVTTMVGRIGAAAPGVAPEIDVVLCLPAHAVGRVPVIVMTEPEAPALGAFHPEPIDQILARGWGCAVVGLTALQADNGAGVASGIIGLANRGRPRRPDQWGALAAWAWGLSRAADHLGALPGVDPRRLGVAGFSRWGKCALLAAALDPRWAVTFAASSGEGGAKPSRHNWGETIDNLCGVNEYYWMAGNFLCYAGHWNALPVDSHELLALIAPRPVFLSCGDKDPWSDPRGQFEAAVAASPVYRLLGAKGLETTTFPPPETAFVSGDIGFRLHEGGHTPTPNWPAFLAFAAKYFSAGAAH
jgi:hypothetical protein